MSFESGIIKSRRGGNVRNGRTTHPQKTRRQESAKARATRYAKLTTQQKLEVLDRTQGTDKANRQRARLMSTIAKENMAVVMKAEKRAEKRK